MDFQAVEEKWRKKWLESGLWKSKAVEGKPKFFIHFAYPGVSGFLHVGHMRGYSYADMIARYKRMTGFNVFFPVGVHASGNQAIGFAKKVNQGDEKWINYLKANGASDEEIEKMKEVDFVVRYFMNKYKEYWELFGFLADWDSLACTVFPDYNKFIQWQFRKLKDKGLLVKKPYVAPFCPNCGPVAIDPSETDISKGGNAEKQEFTVLKFDTGKGYYLVAATLRPETVFGQTNLWVRPDVEYVKARVGNEVWVCSKECVEKLKLQREDVEDTGERVKGEELIGLKVIAPGAERKIIVLPSEFVDPDFGTGIVTSVPSDAPYDYQALMDLKKNKELLDRYGLREEVEALEIIPIIRSKEWGETPAKKICEEMGIRDQNDPKLEEATKVIYKAGFHTGVMNENCGEYAGMKVEQAKEMVKQKLIQEGKADVMYDLSEEVICRCGARVLLKKTPDQWFIKYSDKEWTEESKKHARIMNILPEEYYKNMPGVLDWFQDRACARLGNWLGTKLPFDERWTIEPISDSTLYPAFYVVSRFVNTGKLQLDELTDEFFDYVFLGKGSAEKPVWEEVKKEFEYWYPVDINLGGKEHKTVHFPVYVMNHVAILKPEHWPKGIFVNWFVTGKGGKISKSKGGASASPQEAAAKYSVDALRFYYAHVASPFVDIEWREGIVTDYKKHVENLVSTVEKLSSFNGVDFGIDEWMNARLDKHLREYHEFMNEYDFRKAINSVFFDLLKDLQYYEKRGGNSRKTAERVIEVLLKTMAPFTPFVCEELWQRTGHDGLISASEIPTPEAVNEEALEREEIVKRVEEGINNIMKITRVKPSKITLFVAPEWKRKALVKALELGSPKQVMSLMEEFKEHKAAAKFLQFVSKKYHELRKPLSFDGELKALEEAKDYFEKTFNAEVVVMNAGESGHEKALNAVPGKPAILLE